MKKVLVVTFYFPPRQSTASVRFAGLAKHLPTYGWEPIFLTAKLPAAPDPRFRVIQTHYPGDVVGSLATHIGIKDTKSFHSKLRQILDSAGRNNMILAETFKILRGFLEFPDNQKRWRPFAIEGGHKFLRNEKVDAVFSSSPPQTTHFIAHELAREHNIPWVGDFRDLWAYDYGNVYGLIRKHIDKNIELTIMRAASALVSISEPISETLRSLHRGKKVFTITNGFDPDFLTTTPPIEKFTMTFTGRIHFKQMSNLPLLFQALQELIASGYIDKNVLEVRFFGTEQDWIEQEIKRFGLELVVKQMGELRRADVVQRQKESQILLLFNWNDPKELGCFGGKVFEYLAARRPILTIGLVDNNVQANLITTTNAGVHVSTLSTLKEAVLTYYKQYCETSVVPYSGIDSEINKYTHKEMARKFAEVFNEVAGQKIP